MTDIKLKPCPFCGKKPIMCNNKNGFYFVTCPNYGCVIGYNNYLWFETEEKAAAAWNTRAESEE